MDRGHVPVGSTHSLRRLLRLPLLPTVLPEFRVGFPTSANLDNPSETKNFSLVILDPVKLTTNTNHHSTGD